MEKVLVVGGSVIDIFAYPKEKIILADSNPGYLKQSLGGVGRNIAENLARLGIDTTLITPVGKDEGRKLVMQNAQEVMLKLSIIQTENTPTYISILNEEYDNVVAIAAMDEIERISKDDIKVKDSSFQNADIIVVDTNLNQETLSYIFDTYKKPFYVDVISCRKADRIKPYLRFIEALKMNRLEAQYLSGMLEENNPEVLAKFFINKGVKEVYITLGKEGSFFMNKTMFHQFPSTPIQTKNTSGAGDAFFAGVIYAKIKGLDPMTWARKAAVLTVQSDHAVSNSMSVSALEEVKL